jgi:tRNA (cmo5U34)-methyltransferase
MPAPDSPPAADRPRDTIYANAMEAASAFRFDARVATVFADMISRSVPGYELTLQMIAVAARLYARAGSHCYDLGCSLGASTLSMRRAAPADCRIIGIDNSPAMVERAREIIAEDSSPAAVDILCMDIEQVEFRNASLITLNFTLQFVPTTARAALLRRIYHALLPGGCLVLSEKIAFDDANTQALLQELHHEYKALQGYSALEIARKRDALDNVLIPETLTTHRTRLLEAGFSRVTLWLQCLNFASLLAIK